jgi:endonuclease YncB( thermonuclease family)
MALVLAAGVAIAASARADTVSTPRPAPITVIDADTVESAGRRWRLDGFDAPEIQAARCGAERERGLVAAARLIAALAEAGGGRIEPVRTRTGRVASGGFGRDLGRLVLSDGRPWADVAIVEGHAVAWIYRLTPARPDWCGVVGG